MRLTTMRQFLSNLAKLTGLALLPLFLLVGGLQAQNQAPAPDEFVLLINTSDMKPNAGQESDYYRLKLALAEHFAPDCRGYSDKTNAFVMMTNTNKKADAKARLRAVKKTIPLAEIRLTTVAELKKLN